MNYKICNECLVEKSLDEFSPHKNGKLGTTAKCKQCRQNLYRESDNVRRQGKYQENVKYRKIVLAAGKRYREKNKDLINEKTRIRYKKRKETLIKKYGGKCECCLETRIEFLSIDHINGGGTKERKEISSTGVFIKLLKASERLEGYRLLCHNCNMAMAYYDVCPHKLIDN
jgi:hypothetical protein